MVLSIIPLQRNIITDFARVMANRKPTLYPRSGPNHLQESRYAFPKIGGIGDQAQHEMPFA